jgi:hypothetical protein
MWHSIRCGLFDSLREKFDSYGAVFLSWSLSFFLATPAAAPSATFTWDGGASHNNNTICSNSSGSNNWITGAPVSSADTGLIFTASTVQTTATQNIANPFLLNSITFDTFSNVTAIDGNPRLPIAGCR